MTHTREYNRPPDSSANFANARYSEQLEPNIPYFIDPEVSIDTAVNKDYFACMVIQAGYQSETPEYATGETPDTFLVVNIRHLPVHTSQRDNYHYRLFERLNVPAETDFIVLGSNFNMNERATGWMPVIDGQDLEIGRSTDARHRLQMSSAVSRNHFTLHAEDGNLSITDTGFNNEGSRFGTQIFTGTPAVKDELGEKFLKQP